MIPSTGVLFTAVTQLNTLAFSKIIWNTISNLPFYDSFTPSQGVDCRGAECSKSKYSVLWALPIPCAFGALYYLWYHSHDVWHKAKLLKTALAEV